MVDGTDLHVYVHKRTAQRERKRTSLRHREGQTSLGTTSPPLLAIQEKALQWVLDYPHPNYPYPNTWTSADIAMFRQEREKDVAATGVLLQETTILL